jgi:hypothetical protein
MVFHLSVECHSEYGREHYLKIKKVVIPSQNEYRLNNLKYIHQKVKMSTFLKKKQVEQSEVSAQKSVVY